MNKLEMSSCSIALPEHTAKPLESAQRFSDNVMANNMNKLVKNM